MLLGLRDIFSDKLRAFLTVGGIAVGVMSVSVISSIGLIGRRAVEDELAAMGMDNIVVTAASDSPQGLWEEELDSIKALSSVKNAMPLMNFYTSVSLPLSEDNCMLWGVNEDAGEVIELTPVHGRLIDRGDLVSDAAVCVIDEALAINGFGRSNVVGRTIEVSINGSGRELEIVGVVQNGVSLLQNMMGELIPSFVYMPYTTLSALSSQSFFNEIAVKLPAGAEGFSDRELSDAVSVDVTAQNLMRQKEQMSGIMDTVTLILSLIAGISLLVSGLSVMTVMMMTVNERTREIGIKKAIGASNADILLEFLSESVAICFTGGIIGALLGILAVSIGCAVVGVAPAIDYAMIAATICFSALTGLLFGVYPAMRAASMSPVDALRSD